MNTLEKIIVEKIQTSGALSVAQFMDYALAHPEHGYYMKQDPFGREGDFITAPEISQCFGEMLAVFFINLWYKMDKPAFQLVEMGAGRGTLLFDFLNIAQKVAPDFIQSATLHIVETSPTLIRIQQEKLKDFSVSWSNKLMLEEKKPLFFIANELLDALPVRQFQKKDGIWLERFVSFKHEAFCFELQEADENLIPETYRQNDFYELNTYGETIVSDIGAFLAKNGGTALFIDYGYTTKTGYKDTLQALSHHEFAHPFNCIGEQDLTTHVNFVRLSNLLQNPHKIMEQGAFLESQGILARGQQLIDSTPHHDKKLEIKSAIERLIDPDQMGQLFKVLIITNNKDLI